MQSRPEPCILRFYPTRVKFLKTKQTWEHINRQSNKKGNPWWLCRQEFLYFTVRSKSFIQTQTNTTHFALRLACCVRQVPGLHTRKEALPSYCTLSFHSSGKYVCILATNQKKRQSQVRDGRCDLHLKCWKKLNNAPCLPGPIRPSFNITGQ